MYINIYKNEKKHWPVSAFGVDTNNYHNPGTNPYHRQPEATVTN
jgi:hypothetical protein